MVDVRKEGPHQEFYKRLFAKFDKGLNTTLDSFRKTVYVSIQKVETRLLEVERTFNSYIAKTKNACIADVNLAEVLVNKELRSKIIMSQWTNKFLSSTTNETLDPVTFCITRFSLNIALSFNDVPPEYIIQSCIHKHLVDYISLESELVIGPSLMALCHISLYPELRSPIVAAGALPTLLKLLIHHDSKLILAQAAKLCASLSLEPSNKTLISQSGCMHAMFDLILGVHQDVDRHIQYYAVCGLVNVMYKSDANRLLAVELNGIKPLLTILRSTSDDQIIIHAIRALANISYGNGYTANCILVAGGGEVLVEILESGDIVRQPLTAHAVLAAFSNICNSDVNQSHIGSITGLVEAAVRICEHARELYLATEAANFFLACCWNNTINKARIANKGGCTALMKRIIRHSQLSDPEGANALCTDKMCLALSSVLIYPTTHERMTVIGGLQETIRLCKDCHDAFVLRALGKVVVAMVPFPDDLLRLHEDDNKHPTEKFGALQVLKKAKFKGFVHLPNPPLWLDNAIDLLSKTDEELRQTGPNPLSEFTDKLDFCKEFCTQVYADTTVLENRDFRGQIFSIY